MRGHTCVLISGKLETCRKGVAFDGRFAHLCACSWRASMCLGAGRMLAQTKASACKITGHFRVSSHARDAGRGRRWYVSMLRAFKRQQIPSLFSAESGSKVNRLEPHVVAKLQPHPLFAILDHLHPDQGNLPQPPQSRQTAEPYSDLNASETKGLNRNCIELTRSIILVHYRRYPQQASGD